MEKIHPLFAKWLERVHLSEKTVPEIALKNCIKSNSEEFIYDCRSFSEECSPTEFFNALLHEVFKVQEIYDKSAECGCYKEAVSRPGLDYYDNRRDRFGSNNLVPYKGQFGSHPEN